MTRSLALAAISLLLGCTTYFPRNDPLGAWTGQGGYRREQVARPHATPDLLLSVAFSGGGTRAAAFSFGVLEELAETRVTVGGRERRLIDEIDSVSGVSGGSFTAAYLALHGGDMLETFPERVLEHDIQGALILRLLWPPNWLKLLSPYWARSDLAADYYNGRIFDGATFGDLVGRDTPFLQIHATDLTTGGPFAFIQEQFDYLCSDLSTFPIGRAVAASAAVPGILSPITLRNYLGCGFRPPAWVERDGSSGGSRALDRAYLNARNLASYLGSGRRFVRVVDGGISDNLGVRGPFESWFHRTSEPPIRPSEAPGERVENEPAEREARVQNVVLIVVNAQTTPDAEWDRFDAVPSLMRIVDAATSLQINRYNLETIELLRRTFDLWNARSARADPPLRFHLLELGFHDVPDPEERRALNRLGTRLSLSRENTLRLRNAARAALRASPEFRSLLRELVD